MHAQSREAILLLRIIAIIPLLSSWGYVQLLLQGRLSSRPKCPIADRPTLASLSLNLTAGPATKHQKGKPGKGSPRLEKVKKEKWKVERQRCGGVREANMWSCRGSGCLGFGVVSVVGSESKRTESFTNPPPPPLHPPPAPFIYVF